MDLEKLETIGKVIGTHAHFLWMEYDPAYSPRKIADDVKKLVGIFKMTIGFYIGDIQVTMTVSEDYDGLVRKIEQAIKCNRPSVNTQPTAKETP